MKKEYNILNYFNMRALFMGIGLSRILSISHEYVFISLLLGTILGLLFLYLFRIEMKKNIFNIIINSIIIIISLIILVNMISTMYLTKMPKYIILLPFILLIMYLVNKEEIVMFRVSNILLIFNLILYSISILSLLKYFNINNFYYTNYSFYNVIKGAIEFALYSTIPTLLYRKDEYSNYSLYKTYLISSISMSLLILLTYGILGDKLSSILRYPEYLILKQIHITSAIQNIENLVSFVWIIDIFILATTSSNSIKYNLNNKKYINIILVTLFIITSLICTRYELLLYTYKYTPLILFISLIILFLSNKKLILR